MNNEKLLELLCELVQDRTQMFDIPTGESNQSFKIGGSYLIRTVTMMYTGRVLTVDDFSVLLTDAAWIADSGRYNNALVTGELNEVEPYPNGVNVSLQSIVDFAPWAHSLPREVK